MNQRDLFYDLVDPVKNPMAPSVVQRCVDCIRAVYEEDGNDERCHGMEDALRRAVLTCIATEEWSGGTCWALADIALKTDAIDFARWCA